VLHRKAPSFRLMGTQNQDSVVHIKAARVACPFPIEHWRGTPYDFHSADAGVCLEVAIGSVGAGQIFIG
jgi:hypothetical protein